MIELPRKPVLKADRPRLLDWGGPLTAPNGGPTQTLLRLGTRFALDFTVPTMRTEPLGRRWSALLMMAKLRGARLRFDQDGLAIGAPGTPVLDGGGQTGSTIAIAGATPRYVIRFGQYFNVIRAGTGRRYLHFATEQVVLDASGAGEVPLFPMLRIVGAGGDAVNLAAPTIEGSLAGNELAWDRLSAPFCDFGTISVTEDE